MAALQGGVWNEHHVLRAADHCVGGHDEQVKQLRRLGPQSFVSRAEGGSCSVDRKL
jgi:hypothetical protein